MTPGGSEQVGRKTPAKRNKHNTLGFTIIEVLIVLAVSSLLFLIVAIIINGRQNKTEFQTAINNVPQQLQQIISETASGYFPSLQNFSCLAQPNGSLSFPSGGTAPQGTNQGCIFLGKVVQFGLKAGQSYDIYPIAGNRAANAIKGGFTSNPSGAQPAAIIALKQSQSLLYGLHITSMQFTKADGTPGGTTGGIGFLTGGTDGVFSTSDGTGLKTTSQQLGLYAVGDPAAGTGTDINTPTSSMQSELQTGGGNEFIPASSVTMCFVSGGTSQSGLITIGVSGGLGVSLSVKENTTCA